MSGGSLDADDDDGVDDRQPDAIDWERVGRVATEPDGSFHWGRLRWALRGRDSSDDPDLTIPLAATVLFTVFAPLFAAFALEPGRIAPLQLAGLGVVAILGIVAVVVDRLNRYYVDDADVVVEELRYRYAAGALSFDEFEASVGRVLRDGPGAVEADPGPASSAGDRNGDETGERRDPVTVLQHRYAVGEIDESEYRRRMRVLGEDIPDAEPGLEDVDVESDPVD